MLNWGLGDFFIIIKNVEIGNTQTPTLIIQPFWQNKERSSDGVHYGIGLAFVKRVAELHSGKLIISNADNGAEVILKLKIIQ